MHGAAAPNHEYIISRAMELAGNPAPRILDYGCGKGELVALARQKGLDFHGVDTYDLIYEDWENNLAADAKDAITRIQNGRIIAPDHSFDVVVSNQVFEHVTDPAPALAEIARVLKPGGTFLALFPTRDIWFEGHVGIYFAHWLTPWPNLQLAYLRFARQLGFGYYGQGASPGQWAQSSRRTLFELVAYHRMRDVRQWWRSAFGSEPRSESVHYMLYRIDRSRLASLAGWARTPPGRQLLEFICRIRAGRVLVVTRPPPAGRTTPAPGERTG